MSKELIVATGRHETRVAILEDDQLVEVFHEREKEYSLAGSIHKGRVTRVLPGMQSAFVDIGLERDAFLYVSDFFEDNDEYDAVVSTAEEKVLKYEKSGESPVPIIETSAEASSTEAPAEQQRQSAGLSAKPGWNACRRRRSSGSKPRPGWPWTPWPSPRRPRSRWNPGVEVFHPRWREKLGAPFGTARRNTRGNARPR